MKFSKIGAAVVAAMLVLASPAMAQTVTVDAARGIVIREYPNVTVVSSMSEKYNGHDVYTFHIRGGNLAGVKTVYVDRTSGKLLPGTALIMTGDKMKVEHECKSDDDDVKCKTERKVKSNGVTFAKTQREVKCKTGDDAGDSKCKTEKKVKVNGETVAKVKTKEKCDANDEGTKSKCEVKNEVKH